MNGSWEEFPLEEFPTPVDDNHNDLDDNYENQLALLDFAQAHNKPVIIAESSPINYGTDWCNRGDGPPTEESGVPTDPELPCQEDLDAGENAWKAWFVPYFKFIRENPQIKAISYINNDWSLLDAYAEFSRKDARLGENDFVGDSFRAEVNPETGARIYRLEADAATEVEDCQPLRIMTKGAEWLRFLPNGDMIVTKGRAVPHWPLWSLTGPLAQEPAFAIADPQGRALLVVDPVQGHVYMRGGIHENQAEIQASGFYYATGSGEGEGEGEGETATVLMRVDDNGEMYLSGTTRSGRMPTTPPLPTPFPAPNSPYGDQLCGDINPRDGCDCFEATAWWAPGACSYP